MGNLKKGKGGGKGKGSGKSKDNRKEVKKVSPTFVLARVF